MKKWFLLSSLMFIVVLGYSQKKVSVSNPLEKFFQENYDSTVFLYGTTYTLPHIYILSKKGNKLYNYGYFYRTIEDLGLSGSVKEVSPLNGKLKIYFKNRIEKYKNSKPSINQYFTYISTDSISGLISNKNYLVESKPLWLRLQEINIWSLLGENNDEFINHTELNNIN